MYALTFPLGKILFGAEDLAQMFFFNVQGPIVGFFCTIMICRRQVIDERSIDNKLVDDLTQSRVRFVPTIIIHRPTFTSTFFSFLPYIALISAFRLAVDTARILLWFLFLPPSYKYSHFHAGARDDRHCERECTWRGSKGIGALSTLVVSRFKTRPPLCQASAISIVLCPFT